MTKRRVLFLCTHNSARSQMAEALLRQARGERYEAHSAGTEATRVHPLAVRAMEELRIDISGQRSKRVDEYAGERFDYVVTVCEDAKERCPVFPGVGQQLHWSLPDPASVEGDEAQRLAAFRSVRDELRRRIEETFRD